MPPFVVVSIKCINTYTSHTTLGGLGGIFLQTKGMLLDYFWVNDKGLLKVKRRKARSSPIARSKSK